MQEENIKNVVIENGITSVGDFAFAYCENLTSVNAGSATELGTFAFYKSPSLSSIDVSKIVKIDTYAFGDCVSLTKLDFSKVETIGNAAFAGCTGLTAVIIRSTTVPTLSDSNAFYNTNNCPIYVPDASVEAYKAASNWSALASRIKPLSEYVEPSNEE